MNGNSAFWDEMNEVALFTDALRAAVPIQPDPRLGATLVPRLAATARASTLEVETRAARRAAMPAARAARWRPRSRLALIARVGIAIALIPLLLAGLAFAGVTLPSPARSAFDSVGVHLPNQPSEESDRTQSPSPQSTGESGAVTGGSGKSGTPNKGKSGAAHEHALSQRAKANGKAKGHSRGEAIGLNEETPPGQSGETGSPAHSKAGASSSRRSATEARKPVPFPKGVATGRAKLAPRYSK